MKLFASIVVLFITLSLSAQDTKMVFQSSNLEMNKQGEKIKANNSEEVTTLTIDLKTNVLTIQTTNSTLIELMRKDLDRKIEKQLGDVTKTQFSLQLEDMMFAHFYLDKNKIILTRSDIHPLKWGIQMHEIILRAN